MYQCISENVISKEVELRKLSRATHLDLQVTSHWEHTSRRIPTSKPRYLIYVLHKGIKIYWRVYLQLFAWPTYGNILSD